MADALVMKLEGPPTSEVAPSDEIRSYNAEFDDVGSILHDLCEALANDGRFVFVVEFRGERWPVDVRTDLVTILEQLPSVPKHLRSTFELDFYEQGIERTLEFSPKGDELAIGCRSNSLRWSPPEGTILVLREVVASMLMLLLSQFGQFAAASRPMVVAHPWFAEWHSACQRILEP
jgi:hypothetical protein